MKLIFLFLLYFLFNDCYSQKSTFSYYTNVKVVSIDSITDRDNYYLIDVIDRIGNKMLILSEVNYETTVSKDRMIETDHYYNFSLKEMSDYKTKMLHAFVGITLDGMNVGFIIGNIDSCSNIGGLYIINRDKGGFRDIAPNGKLPYEAKELRGLYLVQ